MENFWMSILYFVLGGVIGAAIAYFMTKKAFEKQLKENPPINEKMIRAMYAQMGFWCIYFFYKIVTKW